MKKFFKNLFCKHDYYQTGWDEAMDYKYNMRYSIRYYTCKKCGKQIEIDGRYDTTSR